MSKSYEERLEAENERLSREIETLSNALIPPVSFAAYCISINRVAGLPNDNAENVLRDLRGIESGTSGYNPLVVLVSSIVGIEEWVAYDTTTAKYDCMSVIKMVDGRELAVNIHPKDLNEMINGKKSFPEVEWRMW